MNKQNPTPTLNDFIDARIQLAMASLNCVGIGTIQAFDSDYQMASVSINYKRTIKDAAMAPNGIDTVDLVEDYPILVKCPVVFLGGGVARFTLPITVGDPCLVFFADRDIDTWTQYGTAGTPPNSERTHNLSDAIALVGIRPNSNPLTAFDTVKASLIDLHGERLAQSGDIKASARTANHSGWLIMDGHTIGKSGSGATYTGEMYRELFDIVKSAYPNSGSENFDSGNTVTVPDMRGRGVVGADNMGGSQKGVLTSAFTPNRNTLGGLIGEEAHQLTIPEMPKHTHTINVTGGIFSDSGSTADPVSARGSATPLGDKVSSITGNDEKHNTVQPGSIFYLFIKI